MPERPERRPQAKKFTIDISEAWDFPSQIEIIKNELYKLPFYRPGLLYSGFEGLVSKTEGSICCAPEKNFDLPDDYSEENPLMFALKEKNPALAVYDPAKMKLLEENSKPDEYRYEILSSDALIATIILK